MLQSIVVGVSALQPESRMKSRFVRLANCFTGSTFRENVASSPPSAGVITTTTRVGRLAFELMGKEQRFGPYRDMPLQHVSRGVLSPMKKGGDATTFRRQFERIREIVP